MNFTSLEFLVFFPVVLLIYWRMPGRGRWLLLLAASYLFYMDGSLLLGELLLFTTGMSYTAAVRIGQARNGQIQNGEGKGFAKVWMAAALTCCLGSLFLFKREGFLVAGISFYTFQTLAYVLDVYHGRIPPERHFGYYALFVSFFPQLVAGPIERTENLLPQLKKVHAWNRDNLADGCWLLLRGFYKKLAVADYLAAFVDAVYAAPEKAGGLGVVIGTVFFAVQIYCDFSGYTDIARGAALMLGVRLMENFKNPYGAHNIREFWQRWHISLTKWFTDYVYIPLGGSRRGKLAHCRNIWIVFLLSGLWHGLSWNYAAWGLMHGTCFVLYTLYAPRRAGSCGEGGVRRVSSRIVTLSFVCFSWIFFRAESIGAAGQAIGQIVFHFADQGILRTLQRMQLQGIDLFLLPLALFCLRLAERTPDTVFRVTTVEETAKAAFLGFYMVNTIAVSWLIRMAADGGNTFIYFRF